MEPGTGNAWYVARNGETFGPFTLDRMVQGAREGEMRGDDLVWREGMPDWQPAVHVQELWQPLFAPLSIQAAAADREPEDAQPTDDSAATPAAPRDESERDAGASKPAQPRRERIVRHWRGKLTLAQAYWGAGLLLTLLAVALSSLLWRDRNSIERGLLSIPLYSLIRDNDPEAFKTIAGRFSEGIKLGKSMPEVHQDVQSLALADILPRYLQVAPDGAIQRYWRTQLAEMEHLSRTDSAACAAYAFPELRRPDYNITKLVPASLLAEDIAALTDLVQQAISAPDRRRSEVLDRELDAVGARIAARIPDARQVLAEPRRYFDKPRLLCDVVMAFYADVLSLPPRRSGPILRALAEPVR